MRRLTEASRRACSEVARRLARLGHDVTQGSLPLGIPALSTAWPKIGEAGLAALAGTLGERFATAGQKYRDMPNAARGCRLAIHDLVAILGLLVQLRREAARAFARWDVLLTPTCAAHPWPVGEDFPGHIDGIEAGPRGPAIYTGWVNAIGHPAISIPAPFATDGQPVGAQLVAGFNRDSLLLRLARQYEIGHPWSGNWPHLVA